eukprot:TRINITY_DN3050_c0_g1_i1.p1 TRINITY_DN3050_c0_g1~~TRINITY_DN3050_c0_g1_i1.p1  ORF type:complete len:206 (-),score=36.51 TRINITY_DN3050_c0_g1_i1:6-623(-)
MRVIIMAKYVCFLLMLMATYAIAATKTYTIEGKLKVSITPDVVVSVRGPDGRQYTGLPRGDGVFKVRGLASGDGYILEVRATKYVFDTVKIDISSQEDKLRAMKLTNITEVRINYPLELSPLGTITPFKPRQPYDFTSILRNPMILMVGFTMLMTFALPKIMANLDPEAIKEMQATAGDQGEPAKTLQLLPEWKVPAIPQQIKAK